MTTKEKLIALINSDDRSAVLLLSDEVSELADQIIRKLPEWGWSYDKFSALFDAMGKFAVEKFPDAGSIEHLKKLKHEADEAIAEPQNQKEYADILLTFFGAAYKAGFNYEQLLDASMGKFEVLQKRKWKRFDDGTYQHYQEPEDRCIIHTQGKTENKLHSSLTNKKSNR